MKPFRILLTLLAALYLATGFYVVAPDEQAVVRRYGKVVGSPRLPGLQYDSPWGLSRIDRVKPAETKRLQLGRTVDEFGRDRWKSEFLTGDQNIIHIRATVQYTISDPIRYVLRSADVQRLLQDAAESALAASVAQQTVDFVRGEGGPQIQDAVLREIQLAAGRYDLGIRIGSVNLDAVLPPVEVNEYFRQANDARNLRDQLRNQAEADQQRTLAAARSRAQETLDQAHAYAAQTVQQARGSTDRFLALLTQYRRHPRVTSTRLYLESMERILQRLKGKILIDPADGVDVNLIRPRG